MEQTNTDDYLQQGSEFFNFAKVWIAETGLEWGKVFLLAVVTLIIGFWIIRRIRKAVVAVVQKREMDITLSNFFVTFVTFTLKILLLISVASMVGVQMTSFIAILTAATFAIGMALQGSLGHFASGVLILLFRPYKVGDCINTGGHVGTVKDVHLFYTILITFDNKTVIVPNGQISNATIVNYSTAPIRRVDVTCGISYNDNIDQARKVMEDVYKRNSMVLQDPAPMVIVSNLGDSSVDMQMRVHVKGDDYWTALFDLTEEVKKSFDKEGISIPFPQTDVHIYNK